MEYLANQVHHLRAQKRQLEDEVERLALDLGIKEGRTGPGWEEVPK
jgi:hypothetical protein